MVPVASRRPPGEYFMGDGHGGRTLPTAPAAWPRLCHRPAQGQRTAPSRAQPPVRSARPNEPQRHSIPNPPPPELQPRPMHSKGRGLRRGPRSGETGGWRRVGGGYCRLRRPLKLALGVKGTVAGRRLGALGGYPPPPSNASLPDPRCKDPRPRASQSDSAAFALQSVCSD